MIGTPNLTLKEEERKSLEAVYQGNFVFVWLPTRFGKSIYTKLSHSCRRHFFCLIHTRYCFTWSYYSSLLVNTTPICSYGAMRFWNWRAFIIWPIPGSPFPPPPSACWLESLGMRLRSVQQRSWCICGEVQQRLLWGAAKIVWRLWWGCKQLAAIWEGLLYTCPVASHDKRLGWKVKPLTAGCGFESLECALNLNAALE